MAIQTSRSLITEILGGLMWNAPIHEKRWAGYRRVNKGTVAFENAEKFEAALIGELENALSEHELLTLGRLLSRGKKAEIELFIRTHGPNPIFDPQEEINLPVGVAQADVVSLEDHPSEESHRAILNGDIVHTLFQAGEASRFQEGPFYTLNPLLVAHQLLSDESLEAGSNGDFVEDSSALKSRVAGLLKRIDEAKARLPREVSSLILQNGLGPKQPLMIRASLRRVVQYEINVGRLPLKDAISIYRDCLEKQKLLFFVSARNNVSSTHDKNLREQFKFFGFNPAHLVTIEQDVIHGVTADENGNLSILQEDWAADAAGHLYALVQSVRPGDFSTYDRAGCVVRHADVDALDYLGKKGGRILSIIRINDMDRHSTEIINSKALSYALAVLKKGYVNVIETVANPDGQKGGTGITFGDPEIHYLTETHENSFPALSRAFEVAMKSYLEKSSGRHPAYNAMRQWSDLAATRKVLMQFGGRIVFVSRQKKVNDQVVSYLGADLPMGDLSLLGENYKSRMFQLAYKGNELLIHDMKKKENLPLALETILWQLNDPNVKAACMEFSSNNVVPFSKKDEDHLPYAAPAPEFRPSL